MLRRFRCVQIFFQVQDEKKEGKKKKKKMKYTLERIALHFSAGSTEAQGTHQNSRFMLMCGDRMAYTGARSTKRRRALAQ